MEDTANNNITTEQTTTTEVDKSETTAQEVTYTQEQFDKAIQSASSRAKNDILKELGIGSVKEFTELKKSYEDSITEKENLAKDNAKLNDLLILKDLNVKDENSEDFLELARKRITDGKDLKKAAEEVASIYPSMLNINTTTDVKIGSEKGEKSKPESKYSEDMLKRYPFLGKNKKI